MSSMNKVILMGNITRDPESSFLPNGSQVTKFGIAVNRRYTSNGEKREETTFVDVESWGKQAELISEHLTKGSPILLEGRLKFDSWESKDGEKRSKLLVVLENFQFIGGGGDNAKEASQSNAAEKAPEKAPAKETPAGDDDVF